MPLSSLYRWMHAARILERSRRPRRLSSARLAWSPFTLDLLSFVTSYSTVAIAATVVMVSLLATCRESCSHEFCALGAIIHTGLPLATSVAASATPWLRVAVAAWCAGALVAHRIFSVGPVTRHLHEVANGLRLDSPKVLPKLYAIHSSSECVYGVVVRDLLRAVAEQGPSLDVPSQRFVSALLACPQLLI